MTPPVTQPLVMLAGIAAVDTIYPITSTLTPGDKHRCPHVEIVLGGNAANAARAITRLGGRAELLARFGDDAEAQWIRAELDSENVGHAASPPLTGCQTSRSAIIIEPDGARTIANMFDPAFPEEPAWMPTALLPSTAAVLGDVRWEAATLRLLTLARAANIPGVLDGDRAPEDARLLAVASHIAFSMQGLAELTGIKTPAPALTTFARQHLPTAPAGQILAVTNGGDGVYYCSGSAAEHVPAPKVIAVDTLGAGDVWHGAFTLALAEGQPLRPALTFANAAAALKCTRPGGGAGAPRRGEVHSM